MNWIIDLYMHTTSCLLSSNLSPIFALSFYRLLSVSQSWSDSSDAQRPVSAVWGMDSPQPVSTAPTRKVFWWNPHLLSVKELVRGTWVLWVKRCCYNKLRLGTVSSSSSFSSSLWFVYLLLSQVELYSNNTRTSTYGWPLLLCNCKHHGGVWWVTRSTSNVWMYYLYLITHYPKLNCLN